jgi:hypothetical protein
MKREQRIAKSPAQTDAREAHPRELSENGDHCPT